MNGERRAREDTWGRLCNPARLAQPQRPTLRTSHFPDPPPTTLRQRNQPLDKHRGTLSSSLTAVPHHIGETGRGPAPTPGSRMRSGSTATERSKSSRSGLLRIRQAAKGPSLFGESVLEAGEALVDTGGHRGAGVHPQRGLQFPMVTMASSTPL